MSQSLGQRSNRAINDPREREAMVLLDEAGWSNAELAMCFMLDEESVRRVLRTTTPAGVGR